MRCIEMFVSAMTSALTALININMRCIEILCAIIFGWILYWLTLTWDVLKLFKGLDKAQKSKSININMRCIEMTCCVCLLF